MGQGLPLRLRWHHDRPTPDNRRLAATLKSAVPDARIAKTNARKSLLCVPPYFGLGDVAGGNATLIGRAAGWRLLGQIAKQALVPRLARRDSLSTGGKAGPGTNQREASIRRDLEATDRAVSLADIQEFAVRGDGEIERSRESSGHGIEQTQHTVRRDVKAADRPAASVRSVGVAAISRGHQPAWCLLAKRYRAAHQFQV